MKTFRGPNDLDITNPRDYSVGLRGYGNQPLKVSAGFKGSKFGPANRGRKFTKTEIEAWKKLYDSHKK